MSIDLSSRVARFLWVDLVLPQDSIAFQDIDRLKCLELPLGVYLGSRVFSRDNRVFINSKISLEISLALFRLFPKWSIYFVGGSTAEIARVKDWCEFNNISSTPMLASREDLIYSGRHGLLLIEDEFGSIRREFGESISVINFDCFAFEGTPSAERRGLAEESTNRSIEFRGARASNDFRFGAHRRRQNNLDIVVPLFNCKDYVSDCVRSLLAFGRGDIRVIVVDDGSTDGSAEVLLNEFGSSNCFSLLKKANGGCASARNHGRLHSGASHIAFVDADDFVDSDFFPRLLDVAFETGAEVVQGDFVSFGAESVNLPSDRGLKIVSPSRRDDDLPPGGWIKRPSHILMTEAPSIWRRVFRRDWLDSRRIFFPESLRAFDDWFFSVLGLSLTDSVVHVPNTHYHYRQHPHQDTRQNDERHFFIFYSVQLLIERLSMESGTSFFWQTKAFLGSVNWSIRCLDPRLINDFRDSTLFSLQSIYRIFGTNALPHSAINGILDSQIRHDFLSSLSSFNDSEAKRGSRTVLRAGRYHPDVIIGQS